MDPRAIIRQAMAQKGTRTASSNPFEDGPDLPSKVGGQAPGAPQKRNIPKDHPFDPKSLKPLVQTLWSLSVSLGHVLTAHRQFSRLKSVSFSPDGMVGGRGYVMSIKDVRKILHEASEGISTICDTLFDEINAPHWKPKLGDLEKNDEDFVKLLEDAKGYMDDPEGEAEEDREEVEDRPTPKERFEKDEGPGSKMPNGGDAGNESQGPNPARQDRPQMKQKEASVLDLGFANITWDTAQLELPRRYSYDRRADSSVSPDELGGPRVRHLGPGEEVEQEMPVKEPREYDYTSEWENDLSGRTALEPVAESGLPNDADTRTEGYDFGLGYGNGNDAHGQGAGGYENPDPSGKGVYGPRAELPGTPAPRGDSNTEVIEQSTSGMGVPGGSKSSSWLHRMKAAGYIGEAKLPNDGTDPVARSDYYAGPKGNDFDGNARYSESGLPGDDFGGGTTNVERSLPNTGYTGEQTTQPYVKWDSDTRNMRPDTTYQRGPVEGPYVKQ